MDDVVCESCGSGDTCSSLEKIEGYEDRLLVIHCYVCDSSYYQEPVKQGKLCLIVKK